MNKLKYGLVLILSVAFYLTTSISCTDTETIDKTDFAIYYPGMIDIGPSMSGVITAPAYIGNEPSGFEITKVTLDDELYDNQSYVIDDKTGAISIENTNGIPVGVYKLSIKCMSSDKRHDYPDLVSITMMRPVPEGITVEPNKLVIDYADLLDSENGVALPTAQVKTDGNHVSIIKYEIAKSDFSKYFAISPSGLISVVPGSSELEPGKYVLSLKLKTGASAEDEGIFENAIEFDITSRPLSLIYEPNKGVIEEESAQNPSTSFESNLPIMKGSKDNLQYSIKSITPATNKISIDKTTGVISVKGGHGLPIGVKYIIDVNVKNSYSTEGVDFKGAFELEIVDFIEPIVNFSYEDTKAIQAVAFQVALSDKFKGDEVRFEFVDLPAKLKDNLTIDFKGLVSAAKGNTIPLGTYTIKVEATNPKSNPEKPTITSFKLTVEPNPNIFTYVRYGNNLGLTPAENYADQYRIEVGGKFSDINPTPVTDAAVELFYEIRNIHRVSTSIDSETGVITLDNHNEGQVGAAMVTATAGKGTLAEFSIEIPVFFHYASKEGKDKVSIEYSPFVLQVNPKKGGSSVSPVAKGLDDLSRLKIDFRRTFNFYDFTGLYADGQPKDEGTFTQQMWIKYFESIGKLPNYGSKDPVSFYSNESNLSNALLYVDEENHQVVVNPNKWIDEGVNANGLFVGQTTFVTDGDVSKVNNGEKIFPIMIWFDSKF